MTVPNIENIQENILNFPVVGIATVAGGLDIINKIVSGIAQNSGMAYIISPYFSANFSNNLSEIIAQYAQIPVHEIIHEINLEPNNIYIMPENNTLTIMDGVLQLKRNTRNERQNNTVDLFFESLAKVYKSYFTGIMLLSDTILDGILGFKKIKELGGVTLLQNPETAEYKGISQTVIDIYDADIVVKPDDVPAELLQIKEKFILNLAYNEEEHLPKDQQEIYTKIVQLILFKTGNDFSNYKQATIRRRIAIRMVIMQKDTLESYYSLIQNNKKEQQILHDDLLITASYFFRDRHFFDNLNTSVFPSLTENKTNAALRIWVAGCATGEEAYSLAICMHEYLLQTNNEDLKFQIIASDLSEKSIAKARAALYSTYDVQHISKERLQKYFSKNNGQYHVKKIIRDKCIFAVHNLVKDPPFAKIDLISCRNVLLHFKAVLQNKVLASFHYSLKQNGLLLLGNSETVNKASYLFENKQNQQSIFARKIVSGYFSSDVIQTAKSNSFENEAAKKIQTQNRIDELEKELSQLRATIKLNEDVTESVEIHKIDDKLELATQELKSNNEELLCVNDELQEYQKQLVNIQYYSESIIKTIHEPLLVIDKECVVKSANPAFFKYFKTTDEEIENHLFFEIENAQWNISDFKEQIKRVINNEEIIENFRVDMTCASVGKKTLLVNARQIQNSPNLVLLTFNDISSLVDANELLNMKKVELEKQNKQLEAFTSSATHYLEEPLRKIHMFCKRIVENEKNISESSRHDLERVQSLILNMTQLINDLINYSRVNYLEKEYKKTDLNTLLKKSIRDLKDAISEKNAVVSVAPFPELNVIPNQIQQLFANLITNAIRYSKKDVVPEIKIQTEQPCSKEIAEMGGNPDTNYVKICVSDNGIGFEKCFESRIFEPFYRLNTTSNYKGSGLGLTLAQKIVANHRGFIKGISEINSGTTMVIYIPVN
ncbi:CheR family methyltransferase [Flavobacterium seoulense]|uniref:Histidine kinase n=1 Tax=Flavobacterium seoulense TaxID=1492738 RepID=A0A066WN65_9FLAO|nr:CheR family methyltransferase [Flavobacterium seoulense]KDN55467.1 histidine kinase [Flavobacterium seoulense]